MSAHINSPRGGDTVNSLTVTVSVSYDTTRGIDPKKVSAKPTTTWELTCEMAPSPSQTVPVQPGQGTVPFTFTMPQPGDYEVYTELNQVEASSTGPIKTPAGDDDQSPIHVNGGGGGGIIIIPPPPLAPKPASDDGAEDEAGDEAKGEEDGVDAQEEAAAPPCAPRCRPVVIHGLVPNNPADPTTGLLVGVYHVEEVKKDGVTFTRDVLDFLAVAQLHGGGLVGLSDGSAHVFTSFSAVLDPGAHGLNLRYYVLGVLGKVTPVSGGPVT